MTQSDYSLANQSRTSFRSELNTILQAIAENNSGATAPSTTFAYQYWVDTANNLLKQRNSLNTAWVIIGHIDKNGHIRTNAGDPNGSVTGNYEGELLFDTTNAVLWLYTGSSTVWKNALGGSSSSAGLPTNYHDVRVEYTSASTIIVKAGSRCRSSDDTTDIVFAGDTTCILSSSGAGGLDTGSEASSTTYYLYAIYNPSTLTSALLFSTVDESVTGSITLPSGYTKKRQILVNDSSNVFSIFNDVSSNLVSFCNTVFPEYKCRAWVNFDGTAGADLNGTYSQSGTTVTVTATNHGHKAGHVLYATITSGTAVTGTYTVASVTDANTFTYTAGTSLTTSGNITLNRRAIRTSANVSNVPYVAGGDYIINLAIPMPDAYYTAFTTVAHLGSYQGGSFINITGASATDTPPTTNSFRVVTVGIVASSRVNMKYINVSVFR